MAFAQRIASLEHQRAELDAVLHEEVSHPWHNQSKIVQLKRNKLRIRDQIEKLRARDERGQDLIRCRSDTS
jgi:hypothetical protein